MNYVLDTNIPIDFFHKKIGIGDLLKRLIKKGPLGLSIISYAELWLGALKAIDTKKEQEKVIDFINSFSVDLINLDKQTVEIYGQIRFGLENKGRKLDNFDLLIAATAMVRKAELVTRNLKHFERIPGLRLYSSTGLIPHGEG